MAPLTPRAHDIEQAVQHSPHIGGPRPTAGFRRWDERLDQAVLIIAQGLTRAKVPNQHSILGFHITASRMGISALPNSHRRDRSPALNGAGCTFKTGSKLGRQIVVQKVFVSQCEAGWLIRSNEL